MRGSKEVILGRLKGSTEEFLDRLTSTDVIMIISVHTLMCLSIGTPKNNQFSICPKWKIHYFRVSNI